MSSSSAAGVMKGRSCASAKAFTGDGVSTRPRPFGASGEVTTSDGTKPCSTSIASVSDATFGVPKKTKLGEGFMFYFDEMLRMIDEKDAVQVIDLMFEDLCHETAAAALQ